MPLRVPNRTKLSAWRSVCIGRNTALAFAVAPTTGTNSAFLVHIDSCRPTRGQIRPPEKRRVFFFIYFLLVCFHEKNKTSKAVCRQSLLANIDVCGPTYVKNCTSEKKKSAIFLQCTVYLLYGKAYWLIFLKKNYIFTLSFFCANSRIKNIFVIVPYLAIQTKSEWLKTIKVSLICGIKISKLNCKRRTKFIVIDFFPTRGLCKLRM